MGLIKSNHSNSICSQIVKIIQQDIAKNRKVGDQLPSETEYAKQFGVTRSTIQKALRTLRGMNLIQMKQGKGSFVNQTQPRVKMFNFRGFTDYAIQIGAIPVNKILAEDITNSQLLKLKRLRSFKNGNLIIPITIDESLIDLTRFPGLEKHDFSHESLYSVIRHDYQVIPSTSLLQMTAISADEKVSEAFGCDLHTPLLQAQGVVHDENDEIVERVKVIYSKYSEFDLTLGV